MKRTVTISVPTLVLIGVVAVLALGGLTTTNSSAQAADDDGPWVLQPRRCSAGSNSSGFCRDSAYLFNLHTGEVFQIIDSEKKAVTPWVSKKKKK